MRGSAVRKGEEYISQVKLMGYFRLKRIKRRKDIRRIGLIYPAQAIRAVSYPWGACLLLATLVAVKARAACLQGRALSWADRHACPALSRFPLGLSMGVSKSSIGPLA